MKMLKKLKQKLKNRLLNYLLNTITIDELHTYNPKTGKHYLNSIELTEDEAANIGQQARNYRETLLYKILSSTVKNKAQKAMFEKSMSFDDMISGKMILFAIDLQDKIMDKFEASYKRKIRKK